MQCLLWSIGAGLVFFRVGAAAEVDPGKLPPAAPGAIEFVHDIQPLLAARCLRCHGDEKPKSGYRLTSREAALKGGEHGKDIIPRDSAHSPLLYYVARLVPDMEMPPEDKGIPLSPEEVGRLRAWIEQGVEWESETNRGLPGLTATPTVGWTTVNGNAQKFRELYWQREGWNGGLEEFNVVDRPSFDSKVTTSGHILLDDYKLALSVEKDNLGFSRFGWEQFRQYFDGHGGFNPELAPFSFDLNRDLHLDSGRAWTEWGLTLPNWPRVVLGYEYQYREGTESTLAWGPIGNDSVTNALYPSFKNLDERAHILKLGLDYELGGVLLKDDFRGQWYHLDSQQFNESGYSLGSGPVASTAAFTRADDRQSYFQEANTFHVEKRFTDWLFAAGGYLYSRLDASGGTDVENSNLSALNLPGPFFFGYPAFQTQRLDMQRDSHVFSFSGLLGPWEGLNLTFGTQNEWTRQTGFTFANVTNALPFGLFGLDPESIFSDLDRRVFSQELGARFSKIPFTTIYADARFEQDDIGQYQDETGGWTPFVQKTDALSHLTDLRFGFTTSPWRRFSLSGSFRRSDNATDYEHGLKEVGFPNEGYPAFILWRELDSDQAEGKLVVQATSWLKTTLSYELLANSYHTATEPVTADPFTSVPAISPGGRLLAGTYNAHIAGLNATLTPWRRWFLSATLAYQNARTVTSANGNSSVGPYAGDIYSFLFSSSYTLDEKTTLTASYAFATADFAQDHAPATLPLGMQYTQHTLEAGVKRQLAKHKTLGLEYRYYRYDEPTGSFNNFQAHAVFATFACSWP